MWLIFGPLKWEVCCTEILYTVQTVLVYGGGGLWAENMPQFGEKCTCADYLFQASHEQDFDTVWLKIWKRRQFSYITLDVQVQASNQL